MPSFEFRGAEISYVDAGSGEAVLLIPGLGGRCGFWQPFIDKMDGKYRLISFDYPGCGGSQSFDHGDVIKDLAELCFALLDSLKIPQVHIVGHSMGGTVAQTMALARPERVVSLVLSATWTVGTPEFERSFNARVSAMEEGGLEAYVKAQIRQTYPAEFFESGPEVIAAREKSALIGHSSVALTRIRIVALLAFDGSARIGTIQCPILVFSYDDDQVVPPSMSDTCASFINDPVRKRLPKGGHFGPALDVDPYVEVIGSFLDQ